jgi:hypothetical protein
MSNNRNNLKNALTGMYLSGNRQVYKIKSPNGQHFVLVNRSSLDKLLNRNNYGSLHYMIYKYQPFIARNTTTRRNLPVWVRNPLPQYYNNVTPRNNYEFRKWNNTYGMIKPRGPFGRPIKLKNTNHYRLSNKNLRNLRSLRRQNTKNAENFARAQAAKRAANNAERKKYVYGVNFTDVNDPRRTYTYYVNSNGRQILRPGRSAEPVTGPHNLTNIKRRVYASITSFPAYRNYNKRRITITPYRIRT